MTNFEVPLTLYYNKQTKTYMKKLLKMSLIGKKGHSERVNIGNIKIDIGNLANDALCRLISRRKI